MAVPRLAPAGSLSGVVLPQPLPPSEAARIRRIFALQSAGDGRAVDELVHLYDPTLIGTLLADRYEHGGARASELQAWLKLYPDLPDAPAIHALLRPGGPAPAGLPHSEDSPHADNVYPMRTSGSGQVTPGDADRGQAGFAAGLAAWRLSRWDAARAGFEAAATASGSDPGSRAAGAFWAARVHQRDGDMAGYLPWMQKAAAVPDSFYGMLARHVLGLADAGQPAATRFAWGRDTLTEADLDAILALPAGQRALALIQVGQPGRAEVELRLLWPHLTSDAIRRSVMLVARAGRLHGFAEQTAVLLGSPAVHDTAPTLPALAPKGGFQIDPALVFAVVRVESNFDPDAVSGAGARGLMQLTAETMSSLQHFGPVDGGAADEAARPDLSAPAQNLALGQRYLLRLAGLAPVRGDLIHLLGSYNAGPGNFARWSAAIRDGGDPLLFLESIPADETRHFIPNVLRWLWSYDSRLGQSAPSLDELAGGAWPRLAMGRGSAR